MLSIRRILFPTDRSESAAHAYPVAAQLAAALGAELHALYVVLPDIEDLRADEDASTLVPGSPPPGVAFRPSVRAGESAAAEIVEHCREQDIDLIVMGSHGRTGLGRLLIGSVAERVVREAPCPVLTVPKRAPGTAVSRVLAAVDFSPFSSATLEHAAAFARHYAAHLDVLHVLQELTVPSAYGPELAPLVTPELEERSRAELESMVAEIVASDQEADTHVSFGYPASEILRFAENHAVDLVVVSTHGLTGLEHFLIGSVAEKVVRRARCPVLIARSFGKAVAGGGSR